MVKESIPRVYFVVPIVCGILFSLYFLWRSYHESKLWDAYLLYIVLGWFVPAVLSVAFFLLTHLGSKSDVVEYNGREFCEQKIFEEFKVKRGVNLVAFTGITFSGAYMQFFGKEGVQKEKLYISMWRNLDSIDGGYYLVLMNMQKGKEDDLSVDKVALNHTREELHSLIDRIGMGMAEEQQIFKADVTTALDPMTGRTITKTSFKNMNQDVPKDVDVD